MITRFLFSTALLSGFLAAQTAIATETPKGLKDVDSKEIKLGEDEAGCKDSPLLARIPGCSIIQCDSKETQTLEIIVGASTDGVLQKEPMEGVSEILYYLCPAKISLGQITKTSDAALLKGGFKTVFNGKDDDDQPLLTSLKDTQWVQVSTYKYNEYSAYIQTAVNVPAESQATSEALAEEMTITGRVVLNGLKFQTEKSDLPSDAEQILGELHQLLVRQPTWKIRVEGHNDDGPDKQANQVLSQRRASAVASWLLEHGIDQSRVSIQGFGDSNTAGESKNSRIEIIKF